MAGVITDGLHFKQLSAHPASPLAGEVEVYALGSSLHAIRPDGTHVDLNQPWVNVKDFGAVGDGSTNDTAALAAAYSACPTGGTIFFPAGTYITDHWQINKEVHLVGLGWGASIIKYRTAYAGADHMVWVRSGASGTTVGGIKFDSNWAARSGTQGNNGSTISFDSNAQCAIRDCWVTCNGFDAIGSSNTNWLTVERNVVENEYDTGIDLVEGSKNFTIANNYVFNRGRFGIALDTANRVTYADVGPGTVEKNTVVSEANGRGFSDYRIGISIEDAADITVFGNRVYADRETLAGIRVFDNGRRTRIECNYVTSPVACINLDGFVLRGLSSVTVRGNTLVNTAATNTGFGVFGYLLVPAALENNVFVSASGRGTGIKLQNDAGFPATINTPIQIKGNQFSGWNRDMELTGYLSPAWVCQLDSNLFTASVDVNGGWIVYFAPGSLPTLAYNDGIVGPLPIATRATFSNADRALAKTERMLAQTGTMSAPRTVTLMAANAVPAGSPITIVDESGSVTGINTITVTRAGSDTINGGTTLVIDTAYGGFTLESDGTSKWTRVAAAAVVATSISGGTVSASDITLKQSTTAAPIAEGRVEWDTDDDQLVIGNGSGTSVFSPERRVAVGDANYAMTRADRYVALTAALTAPRTWTLPAANSVPAGGRIVVADEIAGVTSTNTLTVVRAGSDTINGGSTSQVINMNQRGVLTFVSNGSNQWLAWHSVGQIQVNNGVVQNSSITLRQAFPMINTSPGRVEYDVGTAQVGIGDGSAVRIYSPDDVVVNRANHTGSQLSSTISDFEGQVFAVGSGRMAV